MDLKELWGSIVAYFKALFYSPGIHLDGLRKAKIVIPAEVQTGCLP
jgi:hypothetical protein